MMPCSSTSGVSLNIADLDDSNTSAKIKGDKLKARHGFLARSHPTRVAARKALASDPHAQQMAGLGEHLFSESSVPVAPQKSVAAPTRIFRARASALNFFSWTE